MSLKKNAAHTRDLILAVIHDELLRGLAIIWQSLIRAPQMWAFSTLVLQRLSYCFHESNNGGQCQVEVLRDFSNLYSLALSGVESVSGCYNVLENLKVGVFRTQASEINHIGITRLTSPLSLEHADESE